MTNSVQDDQPSARQLSPNYIHRNASRASSLHSWTVKVSVCKVCIDECSVNGKLPDLNNGCNQVHVVAELLSSALLI